ncbi:MAG TPA: hypothetical protein VNY27_01385 [Solirubrobacteraceae bacterium]|nr:hypothetical protein [Solirubrobacteraceae bacterium]
MSVAIDPVSGDLYVADRAAGSFAQRVQKFTPDGRFVLEIGKEVNETTKLNLCTQEEVEKTAVKCTGPAAPGKTSTEPFLTNSTLPLVVGGPEDLLYAGDEGRVQEFKADGTYKRELPLTSISTAPGAHVSSLTVNAEGGLYLLYKTGSEGTTVIHRFTASSEEVKDGHFPLTLTARQPKEASTFVANAVAVDASGHLAVSEFEYHSFLDQEVFGSLLDAGTAHLVTSFPVPNLGGQGLAFGAGGELYATALRAGGELVSYAPVTVGELLATSHACAPGGELETNVVIGCTLAGEANAWGVPETAAWFQWGNTAGLGSETPKQPLPPEEALVPLHAAIEAEPDETLFYRLAGEDQPVKSPELLTSETVSFTTPSVPPRVVGEPAASFVKAGSAVLFGELNPEHANTKYGFQYGPCETLEGCPERSETEVLESAAYGPVGVTQEATRLQPGTRYAYRVVAVNERAKRPSGNTAAGVSPKATSKPRRSRGSPRPRVRRAP